VKVQHNTIQSGEKIHVYNCTYGAQC